MNFDEDAFLALLAQIESGGGNAALREQLEQWMKEDPSRRDEAQVARAMLAEMRALKWDDGDPEGTLRRIHQRLAGEAPLALSPRSERPAASSPPRLAWSRRWSVNPIWAGLGLVLVIGVALQRAYRTTRPAAAIGEVREYVSRPGSRTTVTLDDGTQIVLGPASRMRVAANFGASERAVTLDGQALFAVVHNPHLPFVVHTTHADVRDVGTVFSVSDFTDDLDEHVAVEQGEVAIGDVALRARDVAAIDANGHLRIQRDVDVAPYVSWAQGRLVFRDTPLRDVAKQLDRVFDVKITVSDSVLASRHVSAVFDNESIDQVLEAITDVLSARYERRGRTVVIHTGTARARQTNPQPYVPLRTVQAGSDHE